MNPSSGHFNLKLCLTLLIVILSPNPSIAQDEDVADVLLQIPSDPSGKQINDVAA